MPFIMDTYHVLSHMRIDYAITSSDVHHAPSCSLQLTTTICMVQHRRHKLEFETEMIVLKGQCVTDDTTIISEFETLSIACGEDPIDEMPRTHGRH